MATSDHSAKATDANSASDPDADHPWVGLAQDYERARIRVDSLDRLVEWPAERAMLGDIAGCSVLDVGCGNGGNFIAEESPNLQLINGDLNELESMPELSGRVFDRIMFLQSFGYATDPVRTLRTAKSFLADDGFILLTRTQPIRYALERAEANNTSLGEEYFSSAQFSYRSGWNDQIMLTKRAYTISSLINTFTAAGLRIETTIEPQLSEDDRRRYPHKQDWMNKYLGILIFKLRSLPEYAASTGQ